MQEKEFISQIATIHNLLTEISVKGEDAIRMAQILQMCRNIVLKQNQAGSSPDADAGS